VEESGAAADEIRKLWRECWFGTEKRTETEGRGEQEDDEEGRVGEDNGKGEGVRGKG
jgi:hypothetical protein